ncbi:MAG: hypothetical protein NXH85_12790 [Pseudomonadaceae bacterium]|nr:hypothetical protein [Pseudomonadaceae bacterium]
MKQTISGTNMRDVIERVRLQYGDDALIVSQHSQGGRAEIVVEDGCVDPDTERDERKTSFDDELRVRLEAAPRQEKSAPPSARRNNAGLAPELVQGALKLGLSDEFVSNLDVSIADESELRSHILAKVPLLNVDQPMRGVWRLLGSSGVGKTSVAIKLLAARVLRYGTTGARVISADNRRLAGHETLLAAAELLSCEPTVLTSDELLEPTLGKVASHELVLVDSSHRSIVEVERAALPPVPGVSDVVVLPNTWRVEMIRRYLASFEPGRLAGAVVTHVDESPQIASVVSLLAEFDVPLLALSLGTGLPDSLEFANPRLVEALLFEESSFTASADRMGKTGMRTTLRQSSGRFA